MYPSVPFRLRRVLAGVVVGVLLLTLGFYGWTRYRLSQYQDRRGRVATYWRAQYQDCVTSGTPAQGCAAQARLSCLGDRFWASAPPFTLGSGDGADAGTICRFG